MREIQRESTEQCLAEKKLQYKTKAGNHLFCQLCLPFLHTCSIFYFVSISISTNNQQMPILAPALFELVTTKREKQPSAKTDLKIRLEQKVGL